MEVYLSFNSISWILNFIDKEKDYRYQKTFNSISWIRGDRYIFHRGRHLFRFQFHFMDSPYSISQAITAL